METICILGYYGQIQECLGNPTVVVNNAAFFNESNFKKLIDVNLVNYLITKLITCLYFISNYYYFLFSSIIQKEIILL